MDGHRGNLLYWFLWDAHLVMPAFVCWVGLRILSSVIKCRYKSKGYESNDTRERKSWATLLLWYAHACAFFVLTREVLAGYAGLVPSDSPALFPTSRVTCSAKKFRVISIIHAIRRPVYGSTTRAIPLRVLFTPAYTHEADRETPSTSNLGFVRDETSLQFNCIIVKFNDAFFGLIMEPI